MTLHPLALLALLASTASAQTLLIGGFDDTRTFRPLSDSQVTYGYGALVAELTNPVNFGPNGAVGCGFALAPEAAVVDAGYLSTIDVFFTGVINTTVTAAEAAALATWQAAGGHVIVLADSAASSNAPANAILAALGSATVFVSSACPNDANGATVTGTGPIANGPFGNIGGATFAMSLAAEIVPDASMQPLVTCTDNALAWAAGTLGGPNGGLVLCGGDTSWIDLFTSPAGSLYNPSNMPFALNAFAEICDGSGGAFALLCDPANSNSSGSYVTLAGSSLSGPGPLHLEATGGPPGNFGYFLVALAANEPGTPISNGMLCLEVPIARYAPATGGAFNSLGQFDGAGVLQNLAGTSTAGSGFDVPASLPAPLAGTIQQGTTYYFQCWYRDSQRSNFSNVLQFQ